MSQELDLTHTALVLIDVQKFYADPETGWGTRETDRVALQIRDLAAAFHAVGRPVYHVYKADIKKDIKDIDFHHVKPAAQDIVIHKTTRSAWAARYDDMYKEHIDSILQKNKMDSVLLAGFNASGCLKDTALDAKAYGFKTTVIEDLVANDKSFKLGEDTTALSNMHVRGISFEKLKNIQAALRTNRIK